MEVLTLPREIQFHILSKLDGGSLWRARQVCKLWADVVGLLECSTDVWFRCCRQEIPKHILVQLVGLPELLTSLDVGKCLKQPWEFWHDVYMDYERMTLVSTCQPDQQCIPTSTCSNISTCTSLRLKDNILVSGHVDGSVILWNGEETRLLSRHRSHVTEVDVLNTVEDMRDIKDWVTGYKVISVSRDVTIHVSSPLNGHVHKLVHYSGAVNDVSCFGGRFVVAANSSILNGQPIWKVCQNSDVPPKMLTTLTGHEESCLSSVAIWNKEVITGDVIGNLFKWNVPPEGTEPTNPIHLAKFSTSYAKSIYYNGRVLVCLLGDGSLCWRTGSTRFKTLPHNQELEVLTATPMCMACRGRLFALGLNSGLVLIYLFPEEKSWMTFDPATPTCSIKVSQDSVDCLDIGDDGEGPVIVTSSTNEGIKKVYWRPP